ncbi:MAG: flagellar motor switch protein FliG [Desulfobacteraceae bacterium]|jgi:flagellar motor switch protein FliG
MNANKLSGSLKAAILIHAMGRPAASRLLSRLTEEEVGLVNQHLDQLGTISPEVVEQVAREFTNLAQRIKRKLEKMESSTGKTQRQPQMCVTSESELSGLEAILSLSADEIFDLVKDEHPQTISIILIHLDTAIASDVISKLPDEIKADVAVRVTSLDKVNADMVEEINDAIKEILKNKKTVVSKVSGGVDRLAEMLNQADEISSELILNEIEESDAELAAEIKQKMFVFEDLILVDDRGFQKLLRKIETVELAVALKAASEEVKEKVFRNMSERAGEMLQEEIEDMGPVRMKEVLDSQQKITAIIQEMEARGELIISGRRGEEIIT